MTGVWPRRIGGKYSLPSVNRNARTRTHVDVESSEQSSTHHDGYTASGSPPIANRATRPKWLLIAVLAVSAGIPNLVAFDATGLTHDYGFFNLSSVWRICLFALLIAAFAFVSASSLFTFFKATHRRSAYNETVVAVSSATGLRLILIFFAWMIVATFCTFSNAEEIKLPIYSVIQLTAVPFYRIIEWAVVLTITWQVIPTDPSLAVDRFGAIVRYVSITTFIVIGCILVVNPPLAYVDSANSGSFRLGGAAFPPNHLSLVFGLGALYWLVTGKNSLRFAAAALLAIGCILTGSRTGILGCAAAYGSYAFLSKRIAIVVACALAITATFVLFGDQIYEKFYLRGESGASLSTFNNRTFVWAAAAQLIDEAPMVGNGFIVGPKLIQTRFTQSFWAPPHAHNDILNAAVAGGILGGVLLSLIYVVNGFQCWKIWKYAPVVSVTFIPIFISAMFEPSICQQIVVSTIIVTCFVRTVAIVAAARRPLERRWRRGIGRLPKPTLSGVSS